MTSFAYAWPLLAGLFVGVNPFTGPLLRARLDEHPARARATLASEAAALNLGVAIVLSLMAYRFAGFVSGRLTNGLLILGLLSLAGAVYVWRPLGRHREAVALPTRSKWALRYAWDSAYYQGPAWVAALAIGMKSVSTLAFAAAFAVAWVGVATAIIVWCTLAPQRLPTRAPAPGHPTERVSKMLGVAYGAAGAILLAGNVGLL